MTRIDERQVITADNVKWLGEMIALMSAKSSDKIFCHSKVTQLYRGLISDIFYNNHNPNYHFSNGYDLAMEAICFLYQHVGCRLNDTTTVIKYGVPKEMTIMRACYFVVGKLIREDLRTVTKWESYDNPEYVEPCEPFESVMQDNMKESDWQQVDAIIASLDLNKDELQTLDCFLSGKGLSETARTIHCGISTAFDRRKKMQKKYILTFGLN